MRSIQIGSHVISEDSPCFVIAEIGHNHGGSLDTAIRMIHVSSASGAHAVKFQMRKNSTLYSRTLLDAPYENEHSYGSTYGSHRAALEFNDDQFRMCQGAARSAKVECFSTAFDEASVDRIVTLGMPAIKIASGGLTDQALLGYAAMTGLPIVLSTGGGTEREIDQAVNTVARHHDRLVILHCTASYPVRDFAELNLQVIPVFRKRYPEFVIGWSGHDNGIAMAVAAYTLGARVIEKHFTLDRSSKGTDHAFSLEPTGLQKMCRDLKRLHIALGDGVKKYYPSEVAPIAKMRRRQTPEGLRITGEKDVTA